MTLDDRDYFLKRSREEEIAARESGCVVARARHSELAGLYRARCEALGGGSELAARPDSPLPETSPAPSRMAMSD